jgi:predicted DNA-binding ArsR family transcriptional regulator
LGNKTRDTTAIGGEEFKPFDNLTTRWIEASELANFYGSYVLTMMEKRNLLKNYWKIQI